MFEKSFASISKDIFHFPLAYVQKESTLHVAAVQLKVNHSHLIMTSTAVIVSLYCSHCFVGRHNAHSIITNQILEGVIIVQDDCCAQRILWIPRSDYGQHLTCGVPATREIWLLSFLIIYIHDLRFDQTIIILSLILEQNQFQNLVVVYVKCTKLIASLHRMCKNLD